MKLPSRKSLGEFLWNAGAATLLLILPLLVFFRHNDYALLRVEVLICCAFLTLTGLGWGALMSTGRFARVAVVTFLLLLLVDVQTDWLSTVGLRLLLNLVGFGSLCWLLRRRLSRIVVVLFAAMILATLLQPPGEMILHRGDAMSAGAPDQPFLLHIILDEYAAPEALDRRFDEDGAIAGEVSDFFLDHDFTLYSRAYSRLVNTAESVPLILNRGMAQKPNAFWDGSFAKGALLQRNDWFDRIHDLGYELHVMQSDFIRFLGRDGNGELPAGTTLSHYTVETVHALDGADLAAGEKVRFIMGSYFRLSWFVGMFRDGWTAARRSPAGGVLKLPAWDQSEGLVSPLSAMEATANLIGMMKHAQPGQAVFAHLLLPHFPYAFNSDCSLAPMGKTWLNVYDKEMAPARNNEQSRAARYPLYLEQLQCTNRKLGELFAELEKAGVWDDAMIILHGDHGSRLYLTNPMPEFADQMSPDDYMDGFGTLLAIKWPGGQGKLDRRLVPLDDVLEQVCLDRQAPWPAAAYTPDPELLAAPWVFLNDRKNLLEKHPLPSFAHGRAGVAPPDPTDPSPAE